MTTFLTFLAIVVGLVTVVLVAIMTMFELFDSKTESRCTHDCNQGRNCTCCKRGTK